VGKLNEKNADNPKSIAYKYVEPSRTSIPTTDLGNDNGVVFSSLKTTLGCLYGDSSNIILRGSRLCGRVDHDI